MSNNLKRAIKYNRVKGYWYLEVSNHSEYRQLQNGERLTTRGTVQYFSNGTKKYLPNWTVAIMDLVPNFLAGQDVRSKVGNIKLQTGDIVDIYMPFSPSSKRAANEGRFQNRTSTHTGRIYMKPINGKSVPFIIHNINGNVIAEPYGNLSNRITRISRPVESPSNKSHLRYDLPNNRYMRVYEDGREKPVNENELR